MAESAIASAVQTLGKLVVEEGIFLYGVKDQVEWVADELQRMQCFLEDADAKQKKGDKRVKNWVREVTNVAFRAEDVIDTFMLQVLRRRRQRGLLGFIERYTFTLADQMFARHKVGVEIASIKIKVAEISASRASYGIANIGETGGNALEDARVETRRRITPDNELVVGFNVHSEKLVSQLLDAGNERRCCFSIVGMGGLGKTTLAKKIYNHPQINANFSARIWVTVSEDFKPLDLIKSITSKAMGTTKHDLQNLEEDEVKDKLGNFLKSTKYFIVMDDVWRTDVWSMLSEALPEAMNGSRVLLTSRSEEVAKSADPITPPFVLPLLTPDESLKLFTGTVFPTSSVPRELEELVERMVGRCGGLPLALAVLGGIMSTKTPTPPAWMRVEESMHWGSTQEGGYCMDILALSYRNLPDHHRRSCLLYISLFPEDSEISTSELARLWIAEGFIPQKDRETMEDTAQDYLEDFVQASLLQVVRRRYDGSVKTCRIHDLIREMCLIEVKDNRFFGIIPGGTSNGYCGTSSERDLSNTRRLTFENFTEGDLSSSHLPSNLKSLFLRSTLAASVPSGLMSLIGARSHHNVSLRILHGLKLLRVLDLSGLDFLQTFPKEIELTGHLRYLKIVNAKISRLPSSIGNLQNLQTLELRATDLSIRTKFYGLSKYPKELGELPMLKHLFIGITRNWAFGGPSLPPFTTTTKLQTLKWVSADRQWAEESLPRLTSLRRLSIKIFKATEAVCDSLGKLGHLYSLSLECEYASLLLQTVVTSLSHNGHLQKLHLKCFEGPQSLPESNMFPPNLAKLTLYSCALKDDPMPVLEKLPNLVYLELHDAYKGTDLVCTKSGFPRLQKLKLNLLIAVKVWTVEVGAFPNLTHLKIRLLENLAMLPEAVRHMTSLIELEVVKSLSGRLTKDVGEDWHKIQHVSTIIIKRDALFS